MEDHPRFGSGQLVGQLGREMKVKLGAKLANQLNSDPLGPVKSLDKWNTVRFFQITNMHPTPYLVMPCHY
jgi:hypothetical protein